MLQRILSIAVFAILANSVEAQSTSHDQGPIVLDTRSPHVRLDSFQVLTTTRPTRDVWWEDVVGFRFGVGSARNTTGTLMDRPAAQSESPRLPESSAKRRSFRAKLQEVGKELIRMQGPKTSAGNKPLPASIATEEPANEITTAPPIAPPRIFVHESDAQEAKQNEKRPADAILDAGVLPPLQRR